MSDSTKDSTSAGSSGFGPDVTKAGSLARETMKTTANSPYDVIPDKSRKSDSVQADFDKNCEACD